MAPKASEGYKPPICPGICRPVCQSVSPQRYVHVYAQYARISGEVRVSFPYFRHTSCSVCVLCNVKGPFPPRTSPRWHPHPLTRRHDKASPRSPPLPTPRQPKHPPHS
ncbi:unnamed protein product [Pleuronectes platessa]|uniref:Uncharacterized protein n=1 Tax=Pleuronectes platessa TaxID=8262 RepID=A0A9N7Z9L0_PLEPL|nr:unnamed protein product [Pleuronectes platessa]